MGPSAGFLPGPPAGNPNPAPNPNPWFHVAQVTLSGFVYENTASDRTPIEGVVVPRSGTATVTLRWPDGDFSLQLHLASGACADILPLLE
jgi:hypothetical protein